jgi:hypothetical protein
MPGEVLRLLQHADEADASPRLRERFDKALVHNDKLNGVSVLISGLCEGGMRLGAVARISP